MQEGQHLAKDVCANAYSNLLILRDSFFVLVIICGRLEDLDVVERNIVQNLSIRCHNSTVRRVQTENRVLTNVRVV